jgi:hypothetical protein
MRTVIVSARPTGQKSGLLAPSPFLGSVRIADDLPSYLHRYSALSRASSRQTGCNELKRAASLFPSRVLPIYSCHVRFRRCPQSASPRSVRKIDGLSRLSERRCNNVTNAGRLGDLSGIFFGSQAVHGPVGIPCRSEAFEFPDTTGSAIGHSCQEVLAKMSGVFSQWVRPYSKREHFVESTSHYRPPRLKSDE